MVAINLHVVGDVFEQSLVSYSHTILNVVNVQYKMVNVRDTVKHADVISLHWTYQVLSGDEVKRTKWHIHLRQPGCLAVAGHSFRKEQLVHLQGTRS
jgi:hypothetical protein